MRSFLFSLVLLAIPGVASACEPVSIKWNGDYPHNNEKVWSKDYDFGWSKNFLNGTPQENFRFSARVACGLQYVRRETEGVPS